MKRYLISFVLILCASATFRISADEPQTTRKERNTILKANEAFNQKDYEKAMELYNEALQINPTSERARYNLAVAMVKRADEIGGAGGNDHNASPAAPNATDSLSIGLKQSADKIFNELYSSSADKLTRENSIYNSGNILFSADKLQESIEQYKKALRLNPANDNARHNLRVAQLRLQQQQNEDDNKDQDQKDDQDQQQQDQQQDQNQDQNQQQPQQPQQQQQQTNYENILNAAQQNESKTRQRLEQQQQQVAPRRHAKPW